MELVVGSIGAIIVVVVVIWLLALSKTVEIDTAKDREEHQNQRDTERALARDQQMRTSTEPLRCLNCETSFAGPLTDDGCPGCHSTSLVIPEEEYKQTIGRPPT